MTDKQMEEKKREFMEKFFVDIEFGEYDQGLILGKEEVEEMWQWIEKLVEEVEREGYKKGLIDQSIRDVTN